MSERLNVIALISGGKDSFYSLLHCLQNGHCVIALGNLYPIPESPKDSHAPYDLNSLMYQTVGHEVIPLYEKILNIPLYRQPIDGSAIDVGMTYEEDGPSPCQRGCAGGVQQQDETESLTKLLQLILMKHPTANAVSTGAILSTYQRTRIEAVARRLGLVALSYLWQYPMLPPGTPQSLLEDMNSIGLDARVVKVASGGLDERSLWQNVASQQTRARMKSVMARFSDEADGAILGEGGEYETLVIDGPGPLFKGRIEVPDASRAVVREDGGSAWLHISNANVVLKNEEESTNISLRLPDILDPEFDTLIESLNDEGIQQVFQEREEAGAREPLLTIPDEPGFLQKWTFTTQEALTILEEAMILTDAITSRLESAGLDSSCITSTLLLLRSMQDFAIVNEIYARLFPKPNPPARVTIACGDCMQPKTNLKIYLTLESSSALQPKKALHVQSRSYWAPANIGPYSQATTIRIASANSELAAVFIAGQIPLIPSTMQLPEAISMQNSAFCTALSLQHLWRIGIATKVDWWTSVIAYLPHASDIGNQLKPERVMMASYAWKLMHSRSAKVYDEESRESAEPDLWEEKYHAGLSGSRQKYRIKHRLPNWSRVSMSNSLPGESSPTDRLWPPPFFAVEVEQLPRAAPIEWHSQLGIVGGAEAIVLRRHTTPVWAIDQCIFGAHMQVTIAIRFVHDALQIQAWLDAVWAQLGWGSLEARSRTGGVVYQDSSLSADRWKCDCIVPCHRLWNAAGERLALILIYNTL